VRAKAKHWIEKCRCRDCNSYEPTRCGKGICHLHGERVAGHMQGRQCFYLRKTTKREEPR
jgi:hypothetical protein